MYWAKCGGGSSPFVPVHSGCLHHAADRRQGLYVDDTFQRILTNMFLCVQVSMIDQRHAICVQACTKRAFSYCVCTVYTERGCTMVYICLNMTRVNS